MNNSLNHFEESSTSIGPDRKGRVARPRHLNRILGLLLALLFVSLGAVSPASASFDNRQSALFDEANDDFESMAISIEGVLDVYIESGGKIYWNDGKLWPPYKAFLDSQSDFVAVNEEMWAESQRAFTNGTQRFRKAAPRSPNKCLKKARRSMRVARQSFGGLSESMKLLRRTQAALAEESVSIAALILNGTSNLTDGYLDGAIYEFGTDHMIAPPPNSVSERMDPARLRPLIDLMFDAGSDSNALYLSEFNEDLKRAVKEARKARSC
jgi:hypothetical protein